jgi:hypothetical protein
MRRKCKHSKLIFFISIALTLFSFITLYADTTTYQYDDNARKVRIERGTRTYDISGNVTSGGSPMAGVTITLSGARSDTTSTDSSGNYIFDGLLNGNYTITPGKTGYTFTPASRNVGVSNGDLISQNFSGTPSAIYSISGTVTNGASVLSGITMTLSGAASGTTTTNSSGNYTFSGLTNGTYTIAPSKTGYTFSPTSITTAINGANLSGQNFTASCGYSAVRLARATPVYYTSLQAAYNAAVTGDIIQSQAITFTENVSINRNISVTLQGGYDCGYTSNSGNISSLKGKLQTYAGGGTLTISNFTLTQ